MDTPTFRQDFPEFSNTQYYPDSLINFWLSIGVARLNTCTWGTLYNQGLELFTAHYVSIAGQRQRESRVGGQPGGSKGPVTSKAVDKVNIAYDAGLSSNEGAGHWNLTSYGTQFYELMQIVGSGGLQVGGSGGYVIPAGGFWSGPPGWPYV